MELTYENRVSRNIKCVTPPITRYVTWKICAIWWHPNI